MKKLFTKSVKEIGLKVSRSLFPFLLFLLCLPASNFAQLYPGTVDVGIFESTTPGQMEIRIRPTDNNTFDMTNMQFAIKWAEGSNNITVNTPWPIPSLIYNVNPQGSPILDNGYYYQIFASAGSSGPQNWPAGVEILVATFTYSENCGEFEIADDAWVYANNAQFYFEILGFPCTGTIYEPIVNNCGGTPLSVIASAVPDNVCAGDLVQLDAIGSGGLGTYTYCWYSNPPGFTSNYVNPTVNPMVTTTYIVSVDDGVTMAYDSVEVIVNPNPFADAGGDQTICEGSCATLSASGGISFMWNIGETTGDIYVCPMTTTNYTLTVTDINGCTASDEAVVNVNFTPVAGITGETQICMGACATLTASGGVSYEWSNGETTDMITVCPTTITLYTVTVTDANGCTDDAYVEVWFKADPIADAGPDVTICENTCTTLTASGGTDYLWS